MGKVKPPRKPGFRLAPLRPRRTKATAIRKVVAASRYYERRRPTPPELSPPPC